MVVLLPIIILCIVVLSCIYHRYCRSGRLIAKIPGPPSFPIIGNVLAMRQTPENLFRCLRQWRKTYGRIYQLSGFHIRTIHLSHPEDLEVILSCTRYNEKGWPYKFLESWLADGLLVSNGDKWHQRRKMLTPAFHLNILKKFVKTFNEHTESLLISLEKELENERTDLIPLISKVALRILCETSMNTKVHQDAPVVDIYQKAIQKFGQCVVNRLTTPWYFLNFIYKLSLISRKEKTILPGLHGLAKEMVQRRREYRKTHSPDDYKDYQMNGEKPRRAMLDLLLDEEEQQRIDDAGIREELDTFILGQYSAATALIFMLFRMANEPEIQDKIYEEIEIIFGNSERQITLEDFSKLKYLDCCIKETLRLYPSIPFISRYINEDIVVAGYTIPKNSFCDIHIFDVHRNPDIYPDPERFIPERFLPENMNKLHPYAYIPFSAGSRNCIGQKFAIMEMKIVMSGLLRKYRLVPVTKLEDLVFSCHTVLRTSHPIYVRFCKRNSENI